MNHTSILRTTPVFYFHEGKPDDAALEKICLPHPIFSTLELEPPPHNEKWAEGSVRIDHEIEILYRDGLYFKPLKREHRILKLNDNGPNLIVDIRDEFPSAPVLSFYDLPTDIFFGLGSWKPFYGMSVGIGPFRDYGDHCITKHKTTPSYYQDPRNLLIDVDGLMKEFCLSSKNFRYALGMHAVLQHYVKLATSGLSRGNTNAGRSGVVFYELFFRIKTLLRHLDIPNQTEEVQCVCLKAIVECIVYAWERFAKIQNELQA